MDVNWLPTPLESPIFFTNKTLTELVGGGPFDAQAFTDTYPFDSREGDPPDNTVVFTGEIGISSAITMVHAVNHISNGATISWVIYSTTSGNPLTVAETSGDNWQLSGPEFNRSDCRIYFSGNHTWGNGTITDVSFANQGEFIGVITGTLTGDIEGDIDTTITGKGAIGRPSITRSYQFENTKILGRNIHIAFMTRIIIHGDYNTIEEINTSTSLSGSYNSLQAFTDTKTYLLPDA